MTYTVKRINKKRTKKGDKPKHPGSHAIIDRWGLWLMRTGKANANAVARELNR